jgi:hypothetical protein
MARRSAARRAVTAVLVPGVSGLSGRRRKGGAAARRAVTAVLVPGVSGVSGAVEKAPARTLTDAFAVRRWALISCRAWTLAPWRWPPAQRAPPRSSSSRSSPGSPDGRPRRHRAAAPMRLATRPSCRVLIRRTRRWCALTWPGAAARRGCHMSRATSPEWRSPRRARASTGGTCRTMRRGPRAPASARAAA